MHNLPNNLRILRKKHDMRQKDVADYLSITQTAYSYYESGLREPDINTLIKLAKLFNVSLDILVGRYIEVNIEDNIACK